MGPARATLKLVPASPGQGRPAPAGAAGVDLPTLFNLYYGWVAALAARMSGRTGDVEDIVQDVFFQCARKIDTIPTVADAKPWLRTVTVRVVRKRLRAEKWRAWFRSSDEGITSSPIKASRPTSG